MGLLLIALLISIGVALIGEYDDKYGLPAFIACIIIWSLISCFIWAKSYTNYVDMKTFYDVTNEQYTSAIMMYKDKAIIDVDKVSFTDFKYEGYQKEISSFIKELRGKITTYNNMYVSKMILKKNFMFNIYIIAPVNMKIMAMKTVLKE